MRLISAAQPANGDLTSLHELLEFYGTVLEEASDAVQTDLGLQVTSRLKNTGTILEKLRRSGGATLKSMQDLAGMRTVGGPDRREQDVTVARVAELFGDEKRPPKIVDRRLAPTHGYSAVHVIVFPHGVPVELQARTAWQHEWAEVFEKLADAVGRDIRYGASPERLVLPALPAEPSDPAEKRLWHELKVARAEIVDANFERRTLTVELAQVTADVIADAEKAAVSGDSPLHMARAQHLADKALRTLKDSVARLESKT